jgi:hypothetical protein
VKYVHRLAAAIYKGFDEFASVTVAPAGMPGSPLVYAQPNPPQLYGG